MKEIVSNFIKNNVSTQNEQYLDILLESCFIQSDLADYNLIVIKSENNEPNAKSIKLYNLLKIEQKKLWGSLFKVIPQGVLLKDVLNNTISLLSSLVLLILEFQPLTEYQFSEKEAKLLFVVYQLTSKSQVLSSKNISTNYINTFGIILSDEDIVNILLVLDKMGVGKFKNSIFILEEEIYIER